MSSSSNNNESIQMSENERLIATLKKENLILKEKNKQLQNIITTTAVSHAKIVTSLGNVSKALRKKKEELKFFTDSKNFIKNYLVGVEPIREEKGLL